MPRKTYHQLDRTPSLYRCKQVLSADEAEEFVGKVAALVVNVGTLGGESLAGMRSAATQAHKLGKVWVLDPVGAGATTFRTQVRGCVRSVSELPVSGASCACRLLGRILGPALTFLAASIDVL